MIESGILHMVIPLVILLCAVFVAAFKDLLYAVLALATLSLLLSLEFYILQAPDVAMAEAGVGATITTAIFIIAIKSTKRSE